MTHRLQTATDEALYQLRNQTVEPVFRIIKGWMGFRRFHFRGKVKVGLK